MKTARPKIGRDAIAPLVGEVILIAICVVISAVILMTAGAIAPDSSPEPQMAFTQAKMDGSGIKLTLSDSIPDTEFFQFKFLAFPPGSLDDLAVTFDGSSVYQLNETLTLHLFDLAGDGHVSNGDYMTITSSSGFDTGTWTFHMVFLSSGAATASISLTVY